jgi:hypothetical protein
MEELDLISYLVIGVDLFGVWIQLIEDDEKLI